MEKNRSYPNPEDSGLAADRAPETGTDLRDELVEARLEAELDSSEEAADLLRQIEANRGRPTESDLVLKMKQLRASLRAEVEKELGIYRSPEEEEAKAKAQHEKNMKEVLTRISGEEDEVELLAKLGMLNAEGKFEFPEQIFSPEVSSLWRKYLGIVKKATAAMNAANELHIESADAAALDRLRSDAHNDVTEAVKAETGDTLTFEQARSLVAKMREMSIPNSGELKTTAAAAWELIEKARQKYGEEAA